MVGGWDGRTAVASILGHKDSLSLIYTCGEKMVGNGDSFKYLPHGSLDIKEILISWEDKQKQALDFRAVE